MLRVAGEDGDGVSLGAAASPRYVVHAVARARAAAAAAGRDPDTLDVTCNIITAVAASHRDALARVKRQVALILANGNDYLFTFQPHALDRGVDRLPVGGAQRADEPPLGAARGHDFADGCGRVELEPCALGEVADPVALAAKPRLPAGRPQDAER